MKSQTVLLASTSNIQDCPRLHHLYESLSQDFTVVLLSTETNQVPNAARYWLFRRDISPFLALCGAWANRLKLFRVAEFFAQYNWLSNMPRARLSNFDCVVVLDLCLLPMFKSQFDKVVFDTAALRLEHSGKGPLDDALPVWLVHRYFAKYLSECALIASHSLQMSRWLNQSFAHLPIILNLPQLNGIGTQLVQSKTIQKQGIKRIAVLIELAWCGALQDALREMLSSRSSSIVFTILASPLDSRTLKALVNMTTGLPNVQLMTRANPNRHVMMLSQFDCAVYFAQSLGADTQSSDNAFYDCVMAGVPVLGLGRDPNTQLVEEFNIGKVVTDKELAEFFALPMTSFRTELCEYKQQLTAFQQHLLSIHVDLPEVLPERLRNE